MLILALVLVGSYLLGSIPFGYLAGLIRGIDIRKAGSGNNCSRAAARDCNYDLAKSNLWESAVLLVALYRGGCHLAAPFKSFPSHTWYGTALYPQVKIKTTAILGAGAWGTALAWLWGN